MKTVTQKARFRQAVINHGSAQIIYSNKTRNSECRFKTRIEKLGKSKFIECMNKQEEKKLKAKSYCLLYDKNN